MVYTSFFVFCICIIIIGQGTLAGLCDRSFTGSPCTPIAPIGPCFPISSVSLLSHFDINIVFVLFVPSFLEEP